MLASPAADIDVAMEKLSPAAVEWKLDGIRAQVHRDGGDVAVFTPHARRHHRARAGDRRGRARAAGAQRRARRRGDRAARRRPAARLPGHREPLRPQPRREVPLTALFFDVLHLDGEDLLDEPRRRARRAPRRGRARGAARPARRRRRRRGGRAPCSTTRSRGPRGRDRQVARRALRRRPPRRRLAEGQAACTRSTSSSSPPSGATAAAAAGSRNLHLGARDDAGRGSS